MAVFGTPGTTAGVSARILTFAPGKSAAVTARPFIVELLAIVLALLPVGFDTAVGLPLK